jgi:hypothetical protein
MNSRALQSTLLAVLVLAAGALSLSAQDWRGKARVEKKAEARADFQKYLEVAPTGDYAADVKEYLKSLK